MHGRKLGFINYLTIWY